MFRGYDDSIKWGFQDYLEPIILKPLKEFCREQLADSYHMKLNPKRKEAYQQTVRLIKAIEKEDKKLTSVEAWYGAHDKFWKYFGEHISAYWD
jgi:hypothetical protein